MSIASSSGTSRFYLAAVFPWLRDKVWEWPGDEAKWCQENQKKDTWDCCPQYCTNSQLINQTQEWGQTVVTCSVHWVCHVVNKSMDVSFLPQRTGMFRPQYYLAYACCMKPGCSKMCPRAARNTSFSIIHQWLLIIILIPCLLVLFSLEVLRSIWCRLVCSNSVELNFVKTGLKCKLRVNPQS